MRKLLLLVTVVSFAACSEAPAPTPTPTPTLAPTPTPTPAPTERAPMAASTASPVATGKPAAGAAAAANEVAVVNTALGQFTIRFFPDVAPKHVAHFKKLAREGFYNGLAFHRVVPNGLVQGGDPTTRGNDRSRWGTGEPGQENVQAEFSKLPFNRGTLGAARKGNDVDSATSQFFICLDRNPGWDGQYTVYGEVVSGLDVVEKISKVPTIGQYVKDKVLINKVTIVPGSAQK